MDERVLQFRVGVMVVVTALLGAILVVLFDQVPWFQRTYEISMKFPQAPGVSVNTPVRKSGLLIGRVTDVQLDDGGVLVRAAMQGDIPIPRTNLPVARSSLFGDSDIEFVPSGKEQADTPLLAAGDQLQGTTAVDPLQVVSNIEQRLSTAIDSVAKTSGDIGELARSTNSLIKSNEDQIRSIISKADSALSSFEKTSRSVNSLLDDPKVQEDLRRALVEMPKVLETARATFEDLRKTVGSADRNLQNMEKFTAPLAGRGEQFAARIEAGITNLDKVLSELATFGQTLNNPDGSLGRLINDPALYQNLNEAAENVACLTQQLRPILNDVRVFSDKIARHPEQLGVRGAIERNNGTK
jgi:phospholipid/cholesterol/gamma-HCH transport system substrate-binding protein